MERNLKIERELAARQLLMIGEEATPGVSPLDIRRMVDAMLTSFTPDELRRLAEAFILDARPSDVLSVYSGEADTCCCGCSGTHLYNSAYRELASKRRGYGVDDEDVNDRMIREVIGLLRDNISNVQIDGNNWSIIVGGRIYIAYPVHEA